MNPEEHRTSNAEHRMAARILAHFGVQCSMFSLGSGVQCAKFSILSRASAALDTSATRLSARCVGVLSVALKEKTNLWLAVALMLLAFALTRLLDLMPLNFSAAYALAFCAGAYFPSYLDWGLPLVVMLVSASLLNVYINHVPTVCV